MQVIYMPNLKVKEKIDFEIEQAFRNCKKLRRIMLTEEEFDSFESEFPKILESWCYRPAITHGKRLALYNGVSLHES